MLINILLVTMFNIYSQIAVLPSTCDDLLPEMQEYLTFTEEVANYWFSSKPANSIKIYEIISIRNMYQKDAYNFENPVDDLIKKSLCDCYEQNEKKLYSANSYIVRSFFEENLDKIKQKAIGLYVNLKIEKQIREFAADFTKANRQKIKKLKKQALLNVKQEIYELLNKK